MKENLYRVCLFWSIQWCLVISKNIHLPDSLLRDCFLSSFFTTARRVIRARSPQRKPVKNSVFSVFSVVNCLWFRLKKRSLTDNITAVKPGRLAAKHQGCVSPVCQWIKIETGKMSLWVKQPIGHQADCPVFVTRRSNHCQPVCWLSHNPVLLFWRRTKNHCHCLSCCKIAIEPKSYLLKILGVDFGVPKFYFGITHK